MDVSVQPLLGCYGWDIGGSSTEMHLLDLNCLLNLNRRGASGAASPPSRPALQLNRVS